jgi:hypothetical protein
LERRDGDGNERKSSGRHALSGRVKEFPARVAIATSPSSNVASVPEQFRREA